MLKSGVACYSVAILQWAISLVAWERKCNTIRSQAQHREFRRCSPMAAHTFPRQSMPFVGRVDELAELAHLLADPACQLLTLVGPGGIGKTRLALEAAEQQVAAFTHGVYFVSLAPISTPESIVPTIADAVGFSFYPGS